MLAKWNKNKLPQCLNRTAFIYNEGGIADNTLPCDFLCQCVWCKIMG